MNVKYLEVNGSNKNTSFYQSLPFIFDVDMSEAVPGRVEEASSGLGRKMSGVCVRILPASVRGS